MLTPRPIGCDVASEHLAARYREGSMNHSDMTPEEEHEFYGRPENQLPQGPAQRRKQRLTDPELGSATGSSPR